MYFDLHISIYVHVSLKKGTQLRDCISDPKLQNTSCECHVNHVNFRKINKVTLAVSVSWHTAGTGGLPLKSVVHRLWEAVTGSLSSWEVFHWMQTTATQGGHKSLIVCTLTHCGILGTCGSQRGKRNEAWGPVVFCVL